MLRDAVNLPLALAPSPRPSLTHFNSSSIECVNRSGKSQLASSLISLICASGLNCLKESKPLRKSNAHFTLQIARAEAKSNGMLFFEFAPPGLPM